MKKHLLVLATCAILGLAPAAFAQTSKTSLVQFYENYLALVSSNDYVTTSRDQPEVWDERFDGIAKEAGFEDAAAAIAAGEAMSADADIAALRQAVAERILQEYKPYQE